jgi:hypothetical protein
MIDSTGSPLENVEAMMDPNPFDPFGVQQANPIKLETDSLFDTNNDLIPEAAQDSIVKTEPEFTSSDTLLEPQSHAVVLDNEDEPNFLAEAEIIQADEKTNETEEAESAKVTLINDMNDINTGSDDSIKVNAELSEPATMSHWREVQRERLEQKDAKEKAANDKLRELAKAELDDWYGSYQRSLEKRKQDNRFVLHFNFIFIIITRPFISYNLFNSTIFSERHKKILRKSVIQLNPVKIGLKWPLTVTLSTNRLKDVI